MCKEMWMITRLDTCILDSQTIKTSLVQAMRTMIEKPRKPAEKRINIAMEI